MANVHRWRNFFAKIKADREWLTEESEIKQGVAQAFHHLLSDFGDWGG